MLTREFSGPVRAGRSGLCRALLAGTALASPLALAVVLTGGPATAACAPAGGPTVTCSGTTTNQNNPDGFGTAAQPNLTVNVQSGATVTGTNNGITLNDNITINNSGTVTGTTNNGIEIGGSVIISNAAGATITGDVNGVTAINGTATVTNNGTISGTQAGFATALAADILNLTNNGTIAGALTGVFGNTANVTNNGTITGADSGSGIQAGIANITNNGTVSVTGPLFGTAISVATGTIANHGTVSVEGQGGRAINVNDDATVTNTGTVTANGDNAVGVFTSNRLTLNNSGTITANGGGGVAVRSLGGTIDNSGTISANGDAGTGIVTFGLGDVITNSGTIATNGMFGIGIVAGDGGTVTNSGTMSATGPDSGNILIRDGTTVTNTGTLLAGDGFTAFGILGRFDNTVVNSGTIQVGASGSAINLDSNAALPAMPNVINSGALVVGANGNGILINFNHVVLNSGTITGGAGAFGISANFENRITNTGTISVGAGGIGVGFAGGNNILENFGTIRATGSGMSVDICDCGTGNLIGNGGTLDGKIFVGGAGNFVGNAGLITVTDPGTPITGGDTFTVTNTAGGVGNTFTQVASGTLALRMNNAGAIDRLTADTINPAGTLRVILQPQVYPNALISTNAAVRLSGYVGGGTITAPFDNYTSSSPFVTVTPIYDTGNPNAYTSLGIQLDRVPFNAVPNLTPSQAQIAGALEAAYSPGVTGAAATFFATVFGASSTSVLDQISGQGTTAAQNVAFSSTTMFNGIMQGQGGNWLSGDAGGPGSVTLGGPLQYAPNNRTARGHDAFARLRPEADRHQGRWRAWMQGFGGRRNNTADSSTGAAGQTQTVGGGAFGIDYELRPDLLVGLAAGASESNYSTSDDTTNGRITTGHIGAYGVKTWGPSYLSGALNYARLSNSTTRNLFSVGETARGSFAADQISARLEFGRRFDFSGYVVTPFVAVEPSMLSQHAYTETSVTTTGAPGIFGLNFNAQTTWSLPTFVGLNFSTRTVLSNEAVLSPFARVSWVHEFKPQRAVSAAFITVPGAAFTVDGARAASDSVRLDTGAQITFRNGRSLFANLVGEWSDRGTMYAASGGFRSVW